MNWNSVVTWLKNRWAEADSRAWVTAAVGALAGYHFGKIELDTLEMSLVTSAIGFALPGSVSQPLIDAITQAAAPAAKKLLPIIFVLGLADGLSACAYQPPPSAPPVPVRMTVSDPVSGLAQMATADVQAGISELIAAGASLPTAPLPLQDSLTCGNWLLTAIPQAQQAAANILPNLNTVAGPYSAFIAAKIAAYNVKATIGDAKTILIDQFNHNCGAAVAGDVNAINALLLKAGIAVAAPVGGGFLGGLIPGA